MNGSAPTSFEKIVKNQQYKAAFTLFINNRKHIFSNESFLYVIVFLGYLLPTHLL